MLDNADVAVIRYEFNGLRVSVIFLVCYLFLPVFSQSSILHVPGQYPTISIAVASANHSDTIQISGGLFLENVLVSKSLTFIGADADSTIVVGADTVPTFLVTNAESVFLKNLYIYGKKGYADSANFFHGRDAATIMSSSRVYIDRCILSGGHGGGDFTSGDQPADSLAGKGGVGLRLIRSDSTYINGSRLIGGNAGYGNMTPPDFGNNGGNGLTARGCTQLNIDSTLIIGGGMGFIGLGFPTDAGYAFEVDSGIALSLLRNSCWGGIQIRNSGSLLFENDSLMGSIPDNVSWHAGADFMRCAAVTLRDVITYGAMGFAYGDGGATDGGDGIRISSCDSVVLDGMMFSGGDGGFSAIFGPSCGNGGDGVEIVASRVEVKRGTLRGGYRGGWPDPCPYAHNGAGLSADSLSTVLIDSTSVVILTVLIGQGQPSQYRLFQNYPNPFNPITELRFEVPIAGFVSLKVYDMLGQEVALLVNEVKQPSEYTIRWNAVSQPSGVYYYRLMAGNFITTRKMILMR